MQQYTLINANIISGGTIKKDCCLQIEGGVIRGITSMHSFEHGGVTIDIKGQHLTPAYIDIHTHGAKMFDVMDAEHAGLDRICEHHYATGVGTFLPTTLTASLQSTQKVFDLLRNFIPKVPVSIHGVHMEGPLLSCKNKGAHPTEHLRGADDDLIAFAEQNKDMIKLITVAPDIDDAPKFITWCVQNGIVVSGGHDAAVDTEVQAAVAAGMRGVTHVYCCTSTVSRRNGDPTKRTGLLEYALLNDNIYVEAVADNHHLPIDLMRLLYKVKGYKNICLVSDSIRATGMPDGDYILGSKQSGVPVVVRDGIAIQKHENAFAGSVTPVCDMVHNAVKDAGVPLAEAVAMATQVPADILGLHQVGSVEVGYQAKLNVIGGDGKFVEPLFL